MNPILEALRVFAQPEQLMINEPMRQHTTFRVGGPADIMFFPKSAEAVQRALGAAKQTNTPTLIIGNGSNLIVRDGGIRGLVIALGEEFAEVKCEGNIITAQAGASLARVASMAQANGLSGLEFASGIPGSLGGGCAMNAGAYGGQLSDVLLDALVLLDGEIKTLTRDELQMSYRSTLVLRRGGVVLEARFALAQDDKESISNRMKTLNAQRRDKQPLNFPSAGSTFKRPEGHFAGGLIEKAGLKGRSVGGAQVSEKHAGFIINTGTATAKDILDLIGLIQDEVERQFGVRLETEVRIIGE